MKGLQFTKLAAAVTLALIGQTAAADPDFSDIIPADISYSEPEYTTYASVWTSVWYPVETFTLNYEPLVGEPIAVLNPESIVLTPPPEEIVDFVTIPTPPVLETGGIDPPIEPPVVVPPPPELVVDTVPPEPPLIAIDPPIDIPVALPPPEEVAGGIVPPELPPLEEKGMNIDPQIDPPLQPIDGGVLVYSPDLSVPPDSLPEKEAVISLPVGGTEDPPLKTLEGGLFYFYSSSGEENLSPAGDILIRTLFEPQPYFRYNTVAVLNSVPLVSETVLASETNVSAVPIPGAVWLFSSAAAGLLMFGRRHMPRKTE
jgi:hypothetical protein